MRHARLALVHHFGHRQRRVLLSQLFEFGREVLRELALRRITLIRSQLRQRDENRDEEALALLSVFRARGAVPDVSHEVRQRPRNGRRRRGRRQHPVHERLSHQAHDQSALRSRKVRRGNAPQKQVSDLCTPDRRLDRPQITPTLAHLEEERNDDHVRHQAENGHKRKQLQNGLHQELQFYSLATVGILSLTVTTSKAYEDDQTQKKAGG